MLGVGTQKVYLQRVRDELQRTVKVEVIMDTFMKPEQVASLLRDTILKLNPGLYMAYGMTIVEAAKMVCPYVVNVEDIRVTQLIMKEHGPVFTDYIFDEKLFENRVRSVLLDDSFRTRVAHKVFQCAIYWTE